MAAAQTWLWRVVPAVEKTCPDHLKQAYAKSQAEKPGVSGSFVAHREILSMVPVSWTLNPNRLLSWGLEEPCSVPSHETPSGTGQK